MTSQIRAFAGNCPCLSLLCVVFPRLPSIKGEFSRRCEGKTHNQPNTAYKVRHVHKLEDMSSDQQRRIGFAWQMPSDDGTGTGENGSSGSPSSPTTCSRRGSKQHDDLLDVQHNVWHSQLDDDNQLHQHPPATENTPAIFKPPPPSPTGTTTTIDINPPPDHSEAADSDPDSDFELVDSNTPLQIDGAIDTSVSPYKYIPNALRQLPNTRSIRARFQPRDQWADDDDDWPATAGAKNTMEGDNDYDQPEWNQAGPHADAQDLAGPGDHGMLQCTVTKPQKEGEGTQNLYVSYLVTTDVRTPL